MNSFRFLNSQPRNPGNKTVRFLKLQKKFNSLDINYLNSFFVLHQLPEVGIRSHKQNCYLFVRLFPSHPFNNRTWICPPIIVCAGLWIPLKWVYCRPLPSWQYLTPHDQSQVLWPLSAPSVCYPIDFTLPVGYKKKYPSGEVTAAGACGSIHNQEAKNSVHCLCSQLLPFMQSRIPTQEMKSSIGAGLSSWITLINTVPHRHSQRPVSLVTLDLRLRIEIIITAVTFTVV